MIKITLFIVFIGLISTLAVFIVNEPGYVRIAWGDWLVTTSPGALSLSILIFACLVAALWQIIRWIIRSRKSLIKVRRTVKQRRGYKALTSGFVAAAAGDSIKARRLSQRANRLLEEPSLTLILLAQAAQLEGDTKSAKKYFEQMLSSPETEFLGIRGLLIDASQSGNHKYARELAERAYRIRPASDWVLTSLLELRTRDGDYIGALKVLKDYRHNNKIVQEGEKRRQAALLVEASRAAKSDGNSRDAYKLVTRSVELDPKFVPAVIMAAEMSLLMGRKNAAARTIERSWHLIPHSILASIYREIYEDLDELAQMKHIERLAMMAPEHSESSLILGAAALDAKLWGEARKHLLKVLESDPSARAYRLLARLEMDEGNTKAAHKWLLSASEAPNESSWRCHTCGASYTAWHIVCSSCASLDTIDWGIPIAHTSKITKSSYIESTTDDSSKL